jgi:hypothetical protein
MAAKADQPTRKAGSGARQGVNSRPNPPAQPAPVTQPIELPEGTWERISRKAYQLWEERGWPEGRDLDNWLDAEATVKEEAHEVRE